MAWMLWWFVSWFRILRLDGNGIEVVSMRRMFSVCSRWVARYRLLCWIGSVGATVGAPMVGWLSHLADVSSVRSSLLEDDPESASEVVDGSFVDWLFSSSWSSGLVLAVIASGIVFLLLLVLFLPYLPGKGLRRAFLRVLTAVVLRSGSRMLPKGAARLMSRISMTTVLPRPEWASCRDSPLNLAAGHEILLWSCA